MNSFLFSYSRSGNLFFFFIPSAGRVPVLDDVVYPWLANPEEIPILGIVAQGEFLGVGGLDGL